MCALSPKQMPMLFVVAWLSACLMVCGVSATCFGGFCFCLSACSVCIVVSFSLRMVPIFLNDEVAVTCDLKIIEYAGLSKM